MKGHKEITSTINNYCCIFVSNRLDGDLMEEILKSYNFILSDNAKTFLDRPISKEDIKMATFDLGKFKTSGPNG